MKVFTIIKEKSERIPDKNFVNINGNPLWWHLLSELDGLDVVVNTDSNLTVTGIVLPVLQFELEATSKDFGVLTTSYGAVSTGVEVGTNAVN